MRSRKLAPSKVKCTCGHPKERHFSIVFETACRKWDCLCPKFTPANGQESESDELSELDPVLASPEAKRRARIASSKSKSQTKLEARCQCCGHIALGHTYIGDQANVGPCAIGPWDNRCPCPRFIAAKPWKRQLQPLSTPNPCQSTSDVPDVVITRDWPWNRWLIINGHVKTVIDGVTGDDDPVMVAKYLASHARGPINVIWW